MAAAQKVVKMGEVEYKMLPPLDVSPGKRDPYMKLCAAVVADAAQHAKRGDVESAFWLGSPACRLMVQALGLPDVDFTERSRAWAVKALLSSAGMVRENGVWCLPGSKCKVR